MKSNYAAAEGLLLHTATAYIVSAFVHYAGMEHLNGLPKKVAIPSPGEEDYLQKVIGNFVDQYCMFESEIDEFLRKQANEQQQPDDLRQQPQQCNQQYTEQGAVKSLSPPGLVTLHLIRNLLVKCLMQLSL